MLFCSEAVASVWLQTGCNRFMASICMYVRSYCKNQAKDISVFNLFA